LVDEHRNASRDLTAEPSERARERAIQVLSTHYTLDNIGVAEFERRVSAVYAARSVTGLELAIADLPSLRDSGGMLQPPRARGFIFNVLGGTERRGPWTPPPRLVVVVLMGGVVLDFRDAVFTSAVVDVSIVSLVASKTEILVPPTLRTEVSGVPIAGSFVHRGDSAQHSDDDPLLRVGGVALLGSVEVKILERGADHSPGW
jgi:hypothetical protein